MGLALDFTKLAARRDSFVVSVQGNPAGSSVYALESRAGGWTVRENTSIMGGMMVQTTTLDTDASLAPTVLAQTMTMQGQVMKTDVTFAAGRAKGSATTPTQTGPQSKAIDIAIPAGTIDSDALQGVLPLFRWAADAKFTLNLFSAGKGTVEPITLTVVGSESVTVPAGTFETWKVEQKGGEAGATLFISKDAAHRLVKIAPAGQPIELLLAK